MQKQQCSVVVLGASGRVGRLMLADWAARPPQGLRVRAQRRGLGQPGDIVWDLAQGAPALADAIAGVDVLLVLSGVTPAPGADYGLNRDLGLAALQAGVLSGARHLLIASSAAVYGRPIGGPLDEGARLDPVTAYGRAKLAMERACSDWLDRFQAQTPQPGKPPGMTFLRIGNVAGTDLFFRNLMRATPDNPLLLDQLADGSGPVRSYIGPASLANLMVRLCHLATSGIALPRVLNIGAPGGGIDMAAFGPALLAMGQSAPIVRRRAPEDALPSVQLGLARLAGLCPMAAAEGTAEVMVGQWLALRGAP